VNYASYSEDPHNNAHGGTVLRFLT
jgi:hypothetical protein